MTPTHEKRLVEIGKNIRNFDLTAGKRGKRGWKSAACRLAIDYTFAQMRAGVSIEEVRKYIDDYADT